MSCRLAIAIILQCPATVGHKLGMIVIGQSDLVMQATCVLGNAQIAVVEGSWVCNKMQSSLLT